MLYKCCNLNNIIDPSLSQKNSKNPKSFYLAFCPHQHLLEPRGSEQKREPRPQASHHCKTIGQTFDKMKIDNKKNTITQQVEHINNLPINICNQGICIDT